MKKKKKLKEDSALCRDTLSSHPKIFAILRNVFVSTTVNCTRESRLRTPSMRHDDGAEKSKSENTRVRVNLWDVKNFSWTIFYYFFNSNVFVGLFVSSWLYFRRLQRNDLEIIPHSLLLLWPSPREEHVNCCSSVVVRFKRLNGVFKQRFLETSEIKETFWQITGKTLKSWPNKTWFKVS